MRVNLEYTSHMNHLNPEEIQDELLNCMEDQQPTFNSISDLINNENNTEEDSSLDQLQLLGYLSTLLDSYRYGECDCLYHPLAVILVVSSSDPDPIGQFDNLAQKVINKRFYSQGIYSKAVPFFYFLLHDEGSSINVDDIFRNMKATFNSSLCKLIRLNSLPAHMARAQPPEEFADLGYEFGFYSIDCIYA